MSSGPIDAPVLGASPTVVELRARITNLSWRDQRRLVAAVNRVGPGDLERVTGEIEAAEQRIVRRRAAVPAITYPDTLPITGRTDDLLAALKDHQVLVVAGETGSGKSTQLPKICLEAGRGVLGLIGHTQPRRVAARTIAERVAEELSTELGSAVGYTVRFTDRVSDATYVKVMTDGILLAEIQRDRMLSRYDTLIIDEAHERTLNIDFLLGYLKQLLPRRPDLKLIVTSATIDTARFSEHFGQAPIIEVAGRTYPVEVRYSPFGLATSEPGSDGVRVEDDRDQVQAICDAVEELAAEGPGDVLVFLSGEREIHDTAEALRRLEARPGWAGKADVLPLYARLSAAEQHRIFQSHPGRRIVLATNVAETSLTVPGVRYVVDAGSARMSRYSHRLKVQRLPIEPVSQASANQRAGRCGRVAPGICIRLYSEDDLATRPEFTEPEILRTNLASVILQMTALGLGDVAAFPFLDPPDNRAIRDGVALLEELGALDPDQPAERRRLTRLGTQLARLPVDPRLGRMVLEAERHGCVREVMIIASALSIQDPRERPSDKQQLADESHRRFAVEGSDFLALVKLWDYLKDRQRELSNSQFRKLCRSEYLNYLRVREWQDLFRQLREAAASVGLTAGSTLGHPDRVHQAVLSGLLSHLGMRDGESREFRGARNSRFMIAPGSVVSTKPPKWAMAAQLVETNRLWGRMAAAVQPEWAEVLAPHLVKRSYGEPRWDERSGRAVTSEKVMLYGLPLVAARTIGYDRIDKVAARQMFVRNALVNGEWSGRHRFIQHNRAFIDEVRQLSDRLRRWDLVEDDTIYAFYESRVGADVVSSRHFDQWWKTTKASQPNLLRMTLEDLIGGATLHTDDYPDSWRQSDLGFAVTYRFDPGESNDGVTVHIPLAVLNRVTSDDFDWQVPGFREDLVTALVRTIPKALRRNLTPLAETSREAYRRTSQVIVGRTLQDVLAEVLSDLAGQRVEPSDIDVREVPDHLRITFSVEDDDGAIVATGKDLEALRRLVGGRVRAAIADSAPNIERTGIQQWNFGDLPRVAESTSSGLLVRGFPALLDDGDSVSIRIFSSAAIQQRIMPDGVRRLLLLTVPVGLRGLEREVPNAVHLVIGRTPDTTLGSLLRDCITAAADQIIASNGGPTWEAEGFARLVAAARRDLTSVSARTLRIAGRILAVAADADIKAGRLVTAPLQPSVLDAVAHLRRLVRPGFVTAAGTARLDDVVRYVRGVERRLTKLPEDPQRDRRQMVEVLHVEERHRQLVAGITPSKVTAEVAGLRWMIEELRISQFAQSLGTSGSISAKKISRELDRLSTLVG